MKYKPLFYTASVVGGILVGVYGSPSMHSVATMISDIFMRMFKCISLPIVALSITVALAGVKSGETTKRIWQKAVTYTISTTVIAASVSCALYSLIKPSNIREVC